jgi:hypothetical protein
MGDSPWHLPKDAMPDAANLPRLNGPTALGQRPGASRPRAVSFAAGLLLFQSVLLAATGGATVYLPAGVAARPEPWWLDPFGGLLLAEGVVLLVATAGLLRLSPWSWLLAMFVQGISLAQALLAYLLGTPEYVSMTLGVLAVAALNQAEVRVAFGKGHA